MKFMLVITLCSFISSECPVQFQDDKFYDDWSSCMKSGIIKSKGFIDGIDSNVINNLKIAPKFMCYEVKVEQI